MATITQGRFNDVTPTSRSGQASFPRQVYLITQRNVLTIIRTPLALFPPLLISLFFLVIYESTLGEAATFLPGIEGSYIGFILPLSIISASLGGASIAGTNLVRDIETGYFDKLLLTPVSRGAIVLGPIIAGAMVLGLQATLVVLVGLLMGLEAATGTLGLLAIIGIAMFIGTGFAGFTVAAALNSGNAAATNASGFIFFPLTFLAPSFVPLDLLDGWLKIAARFNPITYVLEAMRDIVNVGWNGTSLGQAALACLIMGGFMYALALRALIRRTKRQ